MWPGSLSARIDNEWRQEDANKSVMPMPANTVPPRASPSMTAGTRRKIRGSFSKSMDKYAFVAFNGS